MLLIAVILFGAWFFLIRKRPAPERADIETGALRVVVRNDGSWGIVHKPVNTMWQSGEDRFGKMTLYNSLTGASENYAINNFQSINIGSNKIVLVYEPITNVKIEFDIEAVDDETVRFSYTTDIRNASWSVQSIDILDESLVVEGENSYVVVPARLGALIPANSQTFTFDTRDYGEGTYAGARIYNMLLLGLVKGSSAVAITWTNIETSVRLEGTGSKIASSIILNKDAKDVFLHFIANGDYVDIAKYYRRVVKDRGLFVSLKEKIQMYPNTEKLVGAVSFKVGLKYSLSTDASEAIVRNFKKWGINIDRGESIIFWTSDDVAKIAEHYKYDLKIDRASFLVYGWMKGGENMYNPEWFPVDNDVGGNEGLADASRRIQSLNYSFALFTNFEILYKSSPLTDPSDARVDSSGKKVEENVWPGGPSYRASPAQQLKYAQMNMPLIRDLVSPNAAFFDMATVVPLPKDFSREHPLNHTQTIEKYKELAEYIKAMVNGPLGGEDGYEWNVPFFDRYEGLAFFKAQGPGIIIPLFELVFRETGVFGTHGGSGISVTSQPPYLVEKEDLLDFIGVGRIPRIHFPPHLYYETEGVYSTDEVYARADNGWAQGFCTTDRLIKNIYEITSPLNELTIHQEMIEYQFLTQDYKVIKTIFSNGYTTIVNKENSDYTYAGITLPNQGFIVNGSNFVAFRARNYNSISYSNPPLFTIRSLDNKNIENSELIRIYHGFGDKNIAIRNKHQFARINGQTIEKSGDYFIFNIEREATVEFYGSQVQGLGRAKEETKKATGAAPSDVDIFHYKKQSASTSVNFEGWYNVEPEFIAMPHIPYRKEILSKRLHKEAF